ncbi:xylulose kinase 2-like [Neltuma alba]|uniref:xylulose kinase 2-like n=1 Tax=Neltuma alba TaxID=207710 RepID=UPI0010A584F0|nr:xylulose kinase 2-like [Prosopis alba]
MAGVALPQDAYFLGFDSSTQSLKATVLDSNLNIVQSELIRFASDLPHYQTEDGVYREPSGNGRIVSPTLMWVEALDLMLQKLSQSELDLGRIAAISGSGQQHGSVYWKTGSSQILSSLDPEKSLLNQLENAFSTKKSPVWMDCSTTSECRKIEEACGGAMELAKLTGSRAYERCTGPQIKKIFNTQPEVYNNTERISLVSSFMASLFIGAYAAIDHSDGSGMNLMDIRKKEWSKLALEATAPNLQSKLGELAPAYAVAGSIAPYFVERYHFNKNCLIINWSGDNPNSVAGLTLNVPGDVGISLGTSDTVFMITKDPNPRLEGPVLPSPVDSEGYMIMLVYKNGSLTREDIRNRFAEKSWATFNKFLQETPPLNGGKLGFYYKDHEILPPLPVGFHRYVIENFTGDSLDGLAEHEVQEFDAPSEVRAIIEGQFLSMRAHAERFGMPFPPQRIIATGGASANHSILSTIASIFGCDVYTVERPGTDSASLGAALRAAHGFLCSEKGSFIPISDLYMHKLKETSLSCKLSVKAGDEKLVSKYGLFMKKRIEIENRLIEKYGRI